MSTRRMFDPLLWSKIVGMPCHAMPSHAMPCCAVLCRPAPQTLFLSHPTPHNTKCTVKANPRSTIISVRYPFGVLLNNFINSHNTNPDASPQAKCISNTAQN